MKIASNSFSIHLITASKVIHEVCLAIVKHLASKSVPSVPFAVLRSSSVPKLYCFHSSFCNTISLLLLPLFWRKVFKTICQISKVCSFGFLYEYRKECIKTLSCFGVIRGGHHIQNSKYSFSPRDIGTLTDIIR